MYRTGGANAIGWLALHRLGAGGTLLGLYPGWPLAGRVCLKIGFQREKLDSVRSARP